MTARIAATRSIRAGLVVLDSLARRARVEISTRSSWYRVVLAGVMLARCHRHCRLVSPALVRISEFGCETLLIDIVGTPFQVVHPAFRPTGVGRSIFFPFGNTASIWPTHSIGTRT